MKQTLSQDIETLRALLWRLQVTHGKPVEIGAADIARASAALDRIERPVKFAALPFWRRLLTFNGPWLLALALCASGCTSTKSAARALDSAGYTHAEFTGSAWWCCNGACFSDGFRAVGPTGVPVEGCVCRGLLKGSTIRLK